ncbi:MAG: peptidylprolyl isomerase [Phycisphaerales bacterium]|nr:peptidylprolyl isomerase [Phycisphaerales bacterium]
MTNLLGNICVFFVALAASAQTTPDIPRDPTRVRPVPPVDSPAVTERLRQFRESQSDPAGSAAALRQTPTASIRATNLYSAPEGPLEIVVRRPESGEAMTLFLIDHAGEVLGMAKGIQGRVNLLQVISGIESLQRAAWLQLALGDEPIGSPIVVQPIREPGPVRTAPALRPDQTTTYTRVVGWGDRPLDPSDPAITALSKSWIAGDPPVLSGFKMYADMDVLIRTDHGEILVALSPDEAPSTAWNFRTLARDGFYDRSGFHRVVPVDREGRPFVIQGGDPTLTGNGGPGFALALEPSALPHDYGVISMARSDDPHSAGSQFFIALGREGTARLDGQYCAFGYAVNGSRAIDSIAATPIANVAEGRPTTIPKILKMQLVAAPARMPGIDRRIDRIRPLAKAGEAPATAR